MKMGGMEVMPESERPFTPTLDSSNSFTAAARSKTTELLVAMLI